MRNGQTLTRRGWLALRLLSRSRGFALDVVSDANANDLAARSNRTAEAISIQYRQPQGDRHFDGYGQYPFWPIFAATSRLHRPKIFSEKSPQPGAAIHQ